MKKSIIVSIVALFASTAFAQQRIIPHVTSTTGGFTTRIFLTNLSDQARNFELTPYLGSGTAEEPITGQLEPNQASAFSVDELFAVHPSHFTIAGADDIRVSVAYQANKPQSSAVHLHETAQSSTQWHLFAGDWSLVFDALALVNTGSTPTTVTIRQATEDGEIENPTLIADLMPNEKALYVINNNFNYVEESFFTITSDQPTAIVPLRGNHGSDFLWENAAVTTSSADLAEMETANYSVTFDATWSAATHPTAYPPSAHFSGLIGATHDHRASFWKEGALASPGIESMAETGSKNPLTAEINAAIGAGTAEFLLSGSAIGSSPGSTTLNFQLSKDHPLVSLVTMIAPSPDWFLGVNSLNLYRDGAWVEQLTVELFPYDSGTDSGTNYSTPNADTVPAETIYRIPTAPLLVGRRIPPLGTFTFVKN